MHDAFAAIVAPEREALPEPPAAVIVPAPQLPATPFGVEITSPAGNASVKATPVNGTVFATGFVIVKLREVAPFSGMLAKPNVFVIVGAAATFRFAVAVFPAPPFVEVTAEVVFVKLPVAVPITFTPNVHELFAAIVAPEREALLEPAVAVIVPPLQVPVSPFGVATTSPAGKVSVNVTPPSAAVFAAGLAIVKFSVVVPFSATLAAPNVFTMVGGPSTAKLAPAVPPVPPSVDVTVPVMLFFAPAVVPVTFTLNVHEPFAASAAPANVTDPDAAVAVIVPPPQVPVSPFGVETSSPAGKVSVNPTVLRPLPAFGSQD